MNQRASHFQLGSTNGPVNSTYNHHYPPKQVPFEEHKQNPFRSNSLPTNEKGNFVTTNKVLYKAWQNMGTAKLNEQKLAQLKGHHFKLGTYNPNQSMTTHQIFHNKKQITGQAAQFQQNSKNKMRAHYHDFKQQNFTNYKTSYTQQYPPKQRQPVSYVNKQKQSNQNNSISFGNHHIPMITTNANDYLPKKAQNINIKTQQTLGVKLGSDKIQPMQTINQLYFNKKQGGPSKLPDATMKQLRNTHFNLGQMKNNYQTQSAYYQAFSAQNQHKKIPDLQSGTWVDKQAKFNATTTYQRQLKARQVEPFSKAKNNNKNGIQLGGHKQPYQTQFKSKYGQKQLSLAYNKQEQKSGNNVVIGQGPNYWTTQQKASYQPKQFVNNHSDIKGKSKQDHFSIGGSAFETKITVYQDEHRKDVDNRNKIFHRDRS